jgi:hypothetical protein
MFVPDRKQSYGLPRAVTEMASLFYMQMMFVPDRKQAYVTVLPVTGITLLLLLFYFVFSLAQL